MICVHKELTDQLSLLATLELKSPFEPEYSQGGFYYLEQELYIRFVNSTFPEPNEGSRIMTISGHVVSVSSSDRDDKKNFCYKMVFKDGSLLLLARFPHFGQAFAKIVICQPGVWVKPYDRAKEILQFIEETFGKISYSVASVDISVHFSGWSPTIEDRLHLSGKFKKKDLRGSEDGLSFSGFTIGSKGRKSRSLYARLYNKSLELRTQHGSPRPFKIYDIPINEKTELWNLEFHFNSRCLRTFNTTTLEEVEKAYPRYWKYATNIYLKHKSEPRTVGESKFRRARLSQEWLRLQSCFSSASSTDIDRTIGTATDMNGEYKLNKLKKNLLNYALFKEIEPRNLKEILIRLEQDLERPSSIYWKKWEEFVDLKVIPIPRDHQVRSLEI